jgi:hydroxymethylglutaryl-CoA synthase
MGLTATLDIAAPGDKIFMVSYGSGAGSDGFIFEVTDEMPKTREKAPFTRTMLDEHKNYIDYGTYTKYRKKIRKGE